MSSRDLPLTPGATGTASLIVEERHTARTMGSGSLDVFATPAMIALMEAAAVDCVERLLPDGMTSLGTHLDVGHLAATPMGRTVRATAALRSADGRALTFDVEAHDGIETIGRGTHRRSIVSKDRFLSRLAAKAARPAPSD